MRHNRSTVVALMRRDGVSRGGPVAVCVADGVGAGLAAGAASGAVTGLALEWDDVVEVVAAIEAEIGPRWVLWSNDTASALAMHGVRFERSWDLAAAHRLLFGGWRAEPARVWAVLHDLAVNEIPVFEPPSLFTQQRDDVELTEPVDAAGYLRPEWTAPSWEWSPQRLRLWADLAFEAAGLQLALMAESERPVRAVATARSESAAELLCVELARSGLPVDRGLAERLIDDICGPRPTTEREADEQRRARDEKVLRHAHSFPQADLRSPADVKLLLRSIGVEVPDTRAWRLEALREEHPLVDALLTWRKAERVSTTFGYGWLDQHLGGDGRLRGGWTGCDGAAGRMTATAGLHNMPAFLRSAVVAEPGYVFVRADLGQIEPRVLAAVSGDANLARATVDDDMYAPVAAELAVDRPTAKVAVLGAMYGQTTGHGAQALRRLERAYPVAMGYLGAADVAGQHGRDLRTFGGRLIRTRFSRTPLTGVEAVEVDERSDRSRTAAQGRFARNAMVQGAAAELFKMWAVTVRARGRDLGAEIVLCLHDELVVHVPIEYGSSVAELLHACLREAAHRWAPGTKVRFVAEVSIIERWSDAGH